MRPEHWLFTIPLRLRSLFRWAQADQELDDELREHLVVIARTVPRFDHPVPVSGPNFLDWRARATQFQSLAGFDGRGFAVMLGNQPENIIGAEVSSTFFSVLQVTPTLGRDFVRTE